MTLLDTWASLSAGGVTGGVTLLDTCASLSTGGVTGGVTLLDTCASLSGGGVTGDATSLENRVCAGLSPFSSVLYQSCLVCFSLMEAKRGCVG